MGGRLARASFIGSRDPRKPGLDFSSIDSIVILRALQLGDMLCAVPAFRALRLAFPSASITLVGLPWAKTFVNRFLMYIDDFIEFPGYPGLPERSIDIERVPLFLAETQRRRFRLALQMHGSGSYVNSITMLMGARYAAGFYVPGEYRPVPGQFFPYPKTGSEIERNQRLIRELGLPAGTKDLEFPVTRADIDECHALQRSKGLAAGKYVCVHPGAQMPSRRWPGDRFAAVADRIAAAGLKVAITGTAGERELTLAVQRTMKQESVNCAGLTSLGAAAVLLKEARLLVSNDTGISHIASALKVPRVIIVTGSDPARWQPPQGPLHRAVLVRSACRPCSHFECPRGHGCARGVSVESVWKGIHDVLTAKEYS